MQLVQGIELDEEKFSFDEKDDVFSISNVLKQCQLYWLARCKLD
jgi:hypothetical protein